MKAIVQDVYGTVPEAVLRLAEIARPTIGDDEILVAVRAAGVDRGTWHVMTGLPYAMRLAGFGVRTPKAPNPGRVAWAPTRSGGSRRVRIGPGARFRPRLLPAALEVTSTGRNVYWNLTGIPKLPTKPVSPIRRGAAVCMPFGELRSCARRLRRRQQ